MKKNREIIRESLKCVRTRKWFWRMIIVMSLLGFANNTANLVVDRFFAAREITTWFGYLEAKLATMAGGLECAVPSRAVALQMSEATAFAIFIATIFGGILLFGVSSVMLKAARDEDAGWFARSFAGFARPLGLAWMGFFLWIRVALWTLLLVVPGIIAGYRYSQCWNIKVENPEWSVSKCIAESTRLMRGHKMQRFVLDLFFLGVVVAIGIFVVVVSMTYDDVGELARSFLYFVRSMLLLVASMLVAMWMSVARALFYVSLKDSQPQSTP